MQEDNRLLNQAIERQVKAPRWHVEVAAGPAKHWRLVADVLASLGAQLRENDGTPYLTAPGFEKLTDGVAARKLAATMLEAVRVAVPEARDIALGTRVVESTDGRRLERRVIDVPAGRLTGRFSM